MEMPIGVIMYSVFNHVQFVIASSNLTNIRYEVCCCYGVYFMFFFDFEDFELVLHVSESQGLFHSAVSFLYTVL